MISLSVLLKHYKRGDIQKEMIEHAANREIAVKFGDKFGKRPDILKYPSDIIELAKQGATSFHASEELWRNPLQLSPNMKKRELDKLRIGWDLVLDIDCPYWEYSKLITHLVIKALKKHGVKSISCKFSGNKGFHIGVPFEAFPKQIMGIDETSLWFPDGVRTIAMYITHYIDSKETDFELTEKIQKDKKIESIAEELNVPYEDLVKRFCNECDIEMKRNKIVSKKNCPYCSEINDVDKNKNFFQCKKCKKLIKTDKFREYVCPKCKNDKFNEKFDISKILNVDTLLISSRHLYRMPYSLHEKSGLCSIPIDPNKVLEFKKETANPTSSKISKFRFLEKKEVPKDNAKYLFDQVGYWFREKNKMENLEEKYLSHIKKEYEKPTIALVDKFFPPCITTILSGLSDGRKRAVFILINFLSNLGWGHEQIEKKLKEWNKKSEEPLRDVYIISKLRYYKQRKDKILPPNCENKGYYIDMRVCHPDNLCSKIKNPVTYSLRKTRYTK